VKSHLLALPFLAACLPPDSPPQKPAAADPAAYTWIVENHIIGDRSAMTDTEANEMHGRKVEITAHGFHTPWHGTCDDSSREEHKRSLSQIKNDVDLSEDRGNKILRFGIRDPILQYTFTCRDTSRVPNLTLYVSGERALTCFGRVCYLLSR
jgi:hypothetical protein